MSTEDGRLISGAIKELAENSKDANSLAEAAMSISAGLNRIADAIEHLVSVVKEIN
jgi:hypothetical protein